MKVLGIVAEYNPFHNGHKLHLEESKKITNTDYTVAVMSGNFTQSGNIAIFDKYTRANLAVSQGVDLVIELPTIFATGSSEYFAYGSIDLLDKLNIVNCICFGSECNDINKLEEIAEILINEPIEFKKILAKELNSGLSYPTARANALSFIGDYADIINKSNNILGIEYIKALKKLNSKIIPHTLKREFNEYCDIEANNYNNVSSATSIRKLIYDKIDFSSHVPYSCDELILSPIFTEDMYTIIRWEIEKKSLNELSNILDVTEGLEHKLKKEITCSKTLTDLINNVKSKRYTQTKIQRILVHICLNITKDIIDKYIVLGNQYIKVLAMNDNGKKIVSEISKNSNLPVIFSTSKIDTINSDIKDLLGIDILASNLYSIVSCNNTNTDYTNKL